MRVLPLVLLVATWCGHIKAQTYSNYQSLVSTMLTNYNPDIIPLNDHTQALDITLWGFLYTLQEVDVVLGKVTVIFSLDAQWQDSQIQWTPSSYGNLNSIMIPKSKVWSPSFILGTPLEFTTLGESWMPVTFLSNGTASLSQGDVLESSCTFNVKFWPFDTHTCDISLFVYGYDTTKVNILTPSSGSTFTVSEIDNVEWKVTGSSSFIRNSLGIQEIVFRIELQRRSAIFIIFVLFPLYALSYMNSLVFLLPQASGGRLGYSMTLLLATTVFLNVVRGFLPNTSNPLPLICLEITLGIVLSIMCALIVIMGTYFYDRSDDVPMHKFYIKFVKLFNMKYRKTKVNNETKLAIGSVNEEGNDTTKYGNSAKVDIENKTAFGEGLSRPVDEGAGKRASVKDLTRLKEENTSGRSTSSETNYRTNDMKITWKDLCDTIDKVTFVSVTMLHVLISIIFIPYLIHGSN